MSTVASHTFALANHLSDSELVAQVRVLVRQERAATAVVIAHLAVLNERRLFLVEGYSSMFTYCTQVLHLSEYEAYSRIGAARAVLKYPIILDMLSDGSVNLTTLGLLVPQLTPENHLDLLAQARHKSKRQIQELLAALRPQPSVPSSVRRLPARGNGPVPVGMPGPAMAEPEGGSVPGAISAQGGILTFDSNHQSERPAAYTPTRPAIVAPLAPERYKVQFTANLETYRKLQLAQDLLRHQIPEGDIGQIIDLALTALLREVTKQKLSATDRPRGSVTNGPSKEQDRRSNGHAPDSNGPRSRHIPAGVRRSVWTRDGGQCAFVANSGHRCEARAFLEFHHVVPYAAGGKATIENIQLRCRAHNGYEAELCFGLRPAQDDISRATDSPECRDLVEGLGEL